MTITVDTFTEPNIRTDTTSPQQFSHAGAVSGVQGVVVAIMHGATAADHITAVSYGGVALTRIQRNVDAGGELGAAELWFRGNGLPAGTQTVSYTCGATTDDIHAVCTTLLSPVPTLRVNSNAGINNNIANPSVALTTSGWSGMAFAAMYSGLSTVGLVTAGVDCTAYSTLDLAGLFTSRVIRQTTGGTGNFTIAAISASDDVAFAAMMVVEEGVEVTGVIGSFPDPEGSSFVGDTDVAIDATNVVGTGATTAGDTTVESNIIVALEGWGSILGWGRGSWGANSIDISAVGSISAVSLIADENVSIDLPSVFGTGFIEPVAATAIANVSISSDVFGTGSVTAVTVSATQNIFEQVVGNQGTGFIETVTVSAERTVTIALEGWGSNIGWDTSPSGGWGTAYNGFTGTTAIGSVAAETYASISVTGVTGTISIEPVSVVLEVETSISGVAGTTFLENISVEASGSTAILVNGVEGITGLEPVSATAEVNASVTGVEGTGAVEAVTTEAAAPSGAPWTASAWATGAWADGAWSVSDITGVQGIGEVGTVTYAQSTSATVTGIEGTGSVGDVSGSGDISTNVTGVEGTGAVEAVTTTATVDAAVTGVVGTGELGTVSVESESQAWATGAWAVGAWAANAWDEGGSSSAVIVDGIVGTSAIGDVFVGEVANAVIALEGWSCIPGWGRSVAGGWGNAYNQFSVIGSVGNAVATETQDIAVTGISAAGVLGLSNNGWGLGIWGGDGSRGWGTADTVGLRVVVQIDALPGPTGLVATGAVSDVSVVADLGPSIIGVAGFVAQGQVGDVTIDFAVEIPVTGVVGTMETFGVSVVASDVIGAWAPFAWAIGAWSTDAWWTETDVAVGVEAVGHVGTVTVDEAGNVFQSVEGLEGTGRVGDASIVSDASSIEVTGVEGTGAVGDADVIPSEYAYPVGVEGLGQVENIVILAGSDAIVPVTMQQLFAYVGNVALAGDQLVEPTGVFALGMVGGVTVWGIIDDGQTPTWTPVNDAQSGSWDSVDNSQTPDWT